MELGASVPSAPVGTSSPSPLCPSGRGAQGHAGPFGGVGEEGEGEGHEELSCCGTRSAEQLWGPCDPYSPASSQAAPGVSSLAEGKPDDSWQKDPPRCSKAPCPRDSHSVTRLASQGVRALALAVGQHVLGQHNSGTLENSSPGRASATQENSR